MFTTHSKIYIKLCRLLTLQFDIHVKIISLISLQAGLPQKLPVKVCQLIMVL